MYFFKSIQKGDYLYSIEAQLSPYKVVLFPMIYITLYVRGGFKVELGFITFFVEFVKLSAPSDTDKFFKLFRKLF